MHHVLDRDMGITIVGTVEEEDTSLRNKYTQGKRLPSDARPQNLKVTVEEGPETYPDYFELQQIPIVSARFLTSLKGAGVDNFDAYPLDIHRPDRVVSGYSLLNIVGRLSCLDPKRTRCTKVGEQVFRIHSLALDPKKLHGEKLFRLHEMELVILVSEGVARALALHSLSGVVLAPAEGWSDSRRF